MEKLGTQIDIVPFPTWAEAAKAFAEGKVDFAHEAMGTAVVQAAGGRPLKVLMATALSVGDGIVATTKIKEVKDLKDKTIGVPMDTEAYYLLLRVLDKAHLKKDDVKIEDAPDRKGAEALAEGKLDALVTTEPYLTKTSKKIKGNVIFNASPDQCQIVHVLVCSENAFSARPDDVLKALKAYVSGLAHWEIDPKASSPIMAKALGLTGTEFGQAMSRAKLMSLRWWQRYEQSGELEMTLGDWASFMQRTKIISKTVDPRAILDTTMFEKASGLVP
jgi:NitT/TauT family transport system substrate-binding protein